MIKSVREMEKALGKRGKKVLEDEKELHSFARRYIYATKDIQIGEKMTKENISVLRSGKAEKGLEPENYEELIGKKASKRIAKGAPIKENDYT